MDKSKMTSITPLENGPLEVDGDVLMKNSTGNQIKTKEKFYLCRCGHSLEKPFCDGTHRKRSFSSQNPRHRIADRRDVYAGMKITIFDNRGICSHAGHCTDQLPNVFQQQQNPWIRPDEATAGEIEKVIKMCPSGALAFRKDEIKTIDFFEDLPTPEIITEKNGPYRIQGKVEITGLDSGMDASKDHFALCRCGASKNKPRCDGAHSDEDFKAD